MANEKYKVLGYKSIEIGGFNILNNKERVIVCNGNYNIDIIDIIDKICMECEDLDATGGNDIHVSIDVFYNYICVRYKYYAYGVFGITCSTGNFYVNERCEAIKGSEILELSTGEQIWIDYDNDMLVLYEFMYNRKHIIKNSGISVTLPNMLRNTGVRKIKDNKYILYSIDIVERSGARLKVYVDFKNNHVECMYGGYIIYNNYIIEEVHTGKEDNLFVFNVESNKFEELTKQKINSMIISGSPVSYVDIVNKPVMSLSFSINGRG